jgi:uncharacterized protein
VPAPIPAGRSCSSIAAAERLNLATIATLDHGHIGLMRPRHAAAFTLLP